MDWVTLTGTIVRHNGEAVEFQPAGDDVDNAPFWIGRRFVRNGEALDVGPADIEVSPEWMDGSRS